MIFFFLHITSPYSCFYCFLQCFYTEKERNENKEKIEKGREREKERQREVGEQRGEEIE
jgi:hypothetical protein